MSIELKNIPILGMSGPNFLIFYGILIIVGMLIIYLINRRVEEKYNRLISPATEEELSNPDPYIVAFLRGGAAEAIRLAVYRLQKFNLLQASINKEKMRPKVDAEKPEELSPVEEIVLADVTDSYKVSEVIHRFGTLQRVEKFCLEELKKKNLDRFLTTETLKKEYRKSGTVAVVIIAIGIAKLFIGISTGHTNIGFLILEMVIGGILLFILVKEENNINAGGKEYLKALDLRFQNLKEKEVLESNQQLILLSLAIFGESIYSAMGYSHLVNYIRPESSFSSSGGSSGCGSSCGGGCGGGCGGCS